MHKDIQIIYTHVHLQGNLNRNNWRGLGHSARVGVWETQGTTCLWTVGLQSASLGLCFLIYK